MPSQLDIPNHLLDVAGFESLLPSEAEMTDVASRDGLAFGRKYLGTAMGFARRDAAQVFRQIGVAQDLVPVANQFFTAATGFQNLSAFQPGVVLPQLVTQFASMAKTFGALDDVPIVGWVVGIGVAAFEVGKSAWVEKHLKTVEALPFGYSKQADESAIRDVIQQSGAADQTEIFLPYNDARDGFEFFNVELMAGPFGEQTKVKRKIALCKGQQMGLGICPGTDQNPRAWQYDTGVNPKTRNVGTPWIIYRPGFQAAGALAWNGVLANTRRCFMVDATRLLEAWDSYWENMEQWAFGDRYSGKTKYRIRWWLMPGMYGIAYDTSEVGPEFYSELPEWARGWWYPSRPGNPSQGLTMRGLTSWVIRRQLRARQFRYLRTLTCAYVSKDDPAFRSDPDLRHELEHYRELLLEHQDRYEVDLSHVVDTDYKRSLQRSRLAVPGDVAQAPGASAPAGQPKRVFADVSKLPPLPPPPGDKEPDPGNAKPFFPSEGGGGLLMLVAAAAAAMFLL